MQDSAGLTVGQLGHVGDEQLSCCVALENRQSLHDVDDHAGCAGNFRPHLRTSGGPTR